MNIGSYAQLLGLLVLMLAMAPQTGRTEIVWNGDFSSADFTQYHKNGSKEVTFFMVPEYGRPVQYGGQSPGHVGNGELLSLVASTERTVNGIYYPKGPTRGGQYAAKFTVKNSADGVEPLDCDVPYPKCDRRRSQLKMQTTHPDVYDALPHMGERWVSWSHFVSSDWTTRGGSFSPVVASIKQRNDGFTTSGYFAISLEENGWIITHRWKGTAEKGDNPWQHQMFYSYNHKGQPYPRAGDWSDGLADFPDVDASYAALKSVNRGGWTDWILHLKQDHRGRSQGGSGFLTLWKREDSGPWVKVLHILPKTTTRGGMTFDHGIGYNLSRDGGGGAGTTAGLYMDKDEVWSAPNNLVLYLANHKIGDERARFSDMSPDGSSPDGEGGNSPGESPPRPPLLKTD